MSRDEKIQFVMDLSASVLTSIVEQIDRMPESWDGIELRWYMARVFDRQTLTPKRDTGTRRRFRDYENEVLTRNL